MSGVLLGSILSAMSTGLGALPILFIQGSITHRFRDTLLAFTAGIMMAASLLSLIPESLATGGYIQLVIGVFLGVMTLTMMEKIFRISISAIRKAAFSSMKRLC